VNQALWFASRGTGLVCLLLLTATVVLGTVQASRLPTRAAGRLTVAVVHRDISLLVLAFLAVHIATAILDPYAGIRWIDAVLPFVSPYQPWWLGLGAVACDLLLAALLTSLLRTRLSYRLWRAVHWTAYACWPLAFLHGIGIGGADSRLGWVLAVDAGCALAVAGAIGRRLLRRTAHTAPRRRTGSRSR
jgi:predicted ferric reductase